MLIVITEYALTHGGRCPTLRWLMDKCSYNSTSAVHNQIINLCNMGYLIPIETGEKNVYMLSGVSVNPPPWFYEVKALYLDRTSDVLDRKWNAKLEAT
jgi:hypothetical protein